MSFNNRRDMLGSLAMFTAMRNASSRVTKKLAQSTLHHHPARVNY
jgi:hypothetical protein